MKLLIWGAGAIGGTLGAYLARAGHDITFVDIVAEHVAAIKRAGLRITGPVAEFSARVPAFTPDEIRGVWPAIILATKAHHTATATRALAPHLSADGYVLSAQNGLNELTISQIVGAARTVGAFVNFGADYLEPGVIHYGGRGAVVVGELGSAGRRCGAGRYVGRVQRLRSGRLSAGGRPRGGRTLELVAFNRRSAKTHSGIWRDLAVRKRRTEVDAQLGIVAGLGAQAGVPTPLTTRLVELIHDIENGARPRSLATLDLLGAAMPS